MSLDDLHALESSTDLELTEIAATSYLSHWICI